MSDGSGSVAMSPLAEGAGKTKRVGGLSFCYFLKLLYINHFQDKEVVVKHRSRLVFKVYMYVNYMAGFCPIRSNCSARRMLRAFRPAFS